MIFDDIREVYRETKPYLPKVGLPEFWMDGLSMPFRAPRAFYRFHVKKLKPALAMCLTALSEGLKTFPGWVPLFIAMTGHLSYAMAIICLVIGNALVTWTVPEYWFCEEDPMPSYHKKLLR